MPFFVSHPNRQLQIRVFSFSRLLRSCEKTDNSPRGESLGTVVKDSLSIDEVAINNWLTIPESMETKGSTSCWANAHRQA